MQIQNLERFQIKDNTTNQLFYGCNQDWYPKARQRRAGCGPSVFSNILLYLFYENYGTEMGIYKENAMQLMDDIWEYVTPTLLGVYSTEIFVKGALAYADEKGIDLAYAVFDITEGKNFRPDLEEIVRFIQSGLKQGVPVAFLNLCSGSAKNVDRWHWMTLVSLERQALNDVIFVKFIDNGEIKETDLKVWYDTTTLGGGLVYFIPITHDGEKPWNNFVI